MEIRALDLDEFDRTRELRRQAFGPFPDAWERVREANRPLAEAGRLLGTVEDGRVVATTTLHEQTQWWHGRAVSLAGFGGVTVAAERRGRGLGRAMVTVALRRAVDLGHALAMLYPATTPIYRSLGWEHAGALDEVELNPEALRRLAAAPLEARRAGPGDAARVAELVARLHRDNGDCGPVGWTEDRWRYLLSRPETDSYLAEDGFLSYRWGPRPGELEVSRVVAGSEETARGLWALVGSGSSIADRVRANVAADDPVLWLVSERTDDRVRRQRWMLRVLDVRAALEGRGYPQGVSASVTFTLDDPHVPANDGTWRLSVADGAATVETAAAPADVRLGARGLSALYAGVPAATLRRTGLLDGGEKAPLDAVFTARAFSLDFF
ncbi:GNAT family N-acetyltransferase [Actinomadura flavalba]|uniref:GNAT family N-acetyltransferase n=1 Tax=Actinomadura flavalba TaxID=1120938 RepID=UPI0003647077|nr:GNAT family N-acetyltransferase [Actinomadura flavalba]